MFLFVSYADSADDNGTWWKGAIWVRNETHYILRWIPDQGADLGFFSPIFFNIADTTFRK